MSKEKTCITCKHFKSWREDFFGDPYEPTDCGLCMFDGYDPPDSATPGVDYVCENHEVNPS